MVSIYALVNSENDDIFYIGATIDPKSRLYQHKNESNKNDNQKSIEIQRILSNGFNVEMDILHTCEISEVSFWENFYIDLFKSYGLELKQKIKSTYSVSYTNGIVGGDCKRVRVYNVYKKAIEIMRDNGLYYSSLESFVNEAIREKIKRVIWNEKDTEFHERVLMEFNNKIPDSLKYESYKSF